MIEWLVLLLILAAGWSLLVYTGLSGWGALPLGFIVGVALVVLTMTGVIVAGLPTAPWVLVLALAVVLVGSLMGARTTGSLDKRRLRELVVGAGLLAVLTSAFRSVHLVTYHIDTFRYLVASLLLSGEVYEYAHVSTIEKRMVAAPAIHSLARLFEEDYLRAFGPVLMVAVLATVVWAAHTGSEQPGPVVERRIRRSTLALAVALIATNSRMLWNTFYVNDHLVFAALTLVAATSGWLLAERKVPGRTALLLAFTLSVGGLVVTRPEGFIVGGLLLLPLVTDEREPWYERAVPTAVFGVTLISWYAFTVASRGGWSEAPLAATGPLLVGVTVVAFAATLRATHDLLPSQPLLLNLAEGGLWLALAFFTLRDPQLLRTSAAATYHNVVGGEGGWGYSLMMLAFLAAAALVMNRRGALTPLRFPLTSLIPVLLLLIYLRESPYRVGHGDSLNRMLMQYIPLTVLYVVVSGLGSGRDAGDVGQPGASDQHEDVRGIDP